MTEQSTIQRYVDGVLKCQLRPLAKTITLVESSRNDHQALAQQILEQLLPHTGNSIRIGISGVPGVGKSTFIESFGLYLIEQGHKVAVLAVDPSSQITGGSIMGDKTRMEKLCQQDNAFIRPSPSSGSLGGVASKTRESMLVCEAAGYDVIIVETVGVGQSETAVAQMTDLFVLLQLPNAGDELQAIKKGIMELADLIVINKADINKNATNLAKAQFRNALHLIKPVSPNWTPSVLACSSTLGEGVAEVWEKIEAFKTAMTGSGEFQSKRQRQALSWMWNLIDEGLKDRFISDEGVNAEYDPVTKSVENGTMTPTTAAQRLLSVFHT